MVELQEVTRLHAVGRQIIHAVAGVSLAIPAGQFAAIVGPSGSGKSTLLNILGCLDRPTSGQYRIEGSDTSKFDDERASDFRNRRIGFVFQSFHLLPRLTVLENVLLPARFLRDPSLDPTPRARTLLERIGLGERLEHRPDQLSGGQMQRVAIARAMLMQPALLLADEPTGNLDTRSANDVLEMIGEVHRAGQTVIMVTHDADVAARAQRQIHLRDGRVEHDSMA